MQDAPSSRAYLPLKEWGPNPASYAFSNGELGRLGQRVPERYLDDRKDIKGTRLKSLCRMGCLPVMNRVGREAKPAWPKENRVCLMCNNGQIEDVHHFVMICPAYSVARHRLLAITERLLANSQTVDFQALNNQEQYWLVLGRRVGDLIVEDRIDSEVKRFLRKAWNKRALLTETINRVLGTTYGQTIQLQRAA